MNRLADEGPYLEASIYFPYNSAELGAEEVAMVMQVAAHARVEPGRTAAVEIRGYADERGPEARNEDLSWARADTVGDRLFPLLPLNMQRVYDARGCGERPSSPGHAEWRRVDVRFVAAARPASSESHADSDAHGGKDANIRPLQQPVLVTEEQRRRATVLAEAYSGAADGHTLAAFAAIGVNRSQLLHLIQTEFRPVSDVERFLDWRLDSYDRAMQADSMPQVRVGEPPSMTPLTRTQWNQLSVLQYRIRALRRATAKLPEDADAARALKTVLSREAKLMKYLKESAAGKVRPGWPFE